MKSKVLKFVGTLLIFAVAASLGEGISWAQSDQSKQGEAGKGAAPTKINKKEEEAYKALYAQRSAPSETQIQLGEDFLKKFPQTHYAGGVYAQLTTAYFRTGQNDKMIEAGNKALELNPDNVDVLALFAMALPRRVNANAPDATQQYQKAEGYARHALELIPNLPKPLEVDDATFEKAKNEELSMCHSGLGLIHIRHQKYEDARNELTQAVQLASNPDPVDYYLLGNADVQTSYFNDAAAAYQKCAESGPLATQCKAGVELAKKDAATKLGR